MSSKDRGNLQRKRSQKIAKQKAKKVKEQRLAKRELPLEYTGRRYQTSAYALLMMATETGIREADEISERKLRDAEVRASLAKLVDRLMAGPPDVARLADTLGVTFTGDRPDDLDLIGWRILSNWKRYFADRPWVPRADLVGLLRTLAHSVRVRTEMHFGGRGYLRFLVDFLGQVGISVELLGVSNAPPDVDEGYNLLELGERWIHAGDLALGEQFRRQVRYQVLSGGAGDVAEICRQLMLDCPDDTLKEQLRLMSIQAISSLTQDRDAVIDVPHLAPR